MTIRHPGLFGRMPCKGLHQIGLGPGAGLVNVFCSKEAGLVLIDTGFPGSADVILKAMTQFGDATR